MAFLDVTGDIREMLLKAKDNGRLELGIRNLAGTCSSSNRIAWTDLKAVVTALRGIGHENMRFCDLCRGASLQFKSPAPRVRDPALIARNSKLQEQLDNQRYEAMVADVTGYERAAAALKESSILPTVRLQLGFGMQVLVTQFTFFILAYLGSKHFLGSDELWAGLFGCLALTFGLLMETVLYMIRSNRPQPLHERFPELFEEKLWGGKSSSRKVDERCTSKEDGPDLANKDRLSGCPDYSVTATDDGSSVKHRFRVQGAARKQGGNGQPLIHAEPKDKKKMK
ncbi:hypothetical protein CEUSTIGMA_g12480.t1 [Chlamydomonas eustigma]|uniref:Uncharacterized protein n=1 Tax=Chlamydomonas eustigma TaxID=1157962 RepID=A0A250XQI5_9CHLO|nr:hypothetical protein CEUSTIGMA_g12480.t1 [Chlamydomonas eustigma]|eukprot:GAX85060.1 hypothetical protein CEUSTIGMA_g12480.t1 [Chlamydomonas eustigma]